VWVLRDGTPVAVGVTPGLSDGRRTEIGGSALHEGDAVIVEVAAAAP
jgi:HlyD family secretion protein